MTLTASAGVGVRASDGKLMWHYERAANDVANIATPVFSDNKVFYTSAYDTGAGLLGLTAQNGEVKASEIYFTRNMKNHHGGVVLVDGYLYGFNDSILTCLEFATGKQMWRDRSVGKGAVTYAEGNLYIQGENNLVGLAEASPSGYKEKGRFAIADQGFPSWAHPVVSGGTVVRAQSGNAGGVRHQGQVSPRPERSTAGLRESSAVSARRCFRRSSRMRLIGRGCRRRISSRPPATPRPRLPPGCG